MASHIASSLVVSVPSIDYYDYDNDDSVLWELDVVLAADLLGTYDITVSVPVSVVVSSNIVSRIIETNNEDDVLDHVHNLNILEDLDLVDLNVDRLEDDEVVLVSVSVSVVVVISVVSVVVVAIS